MEMGGELAEGQARPSVLIEHRGQATDPDQPVRVVAEVAAVLDRGDDDMVNAG